MKIRTLKDLGHLIRDYRQKSTLTQAALAERVGVSRKWINDVETGKSSADISLILRTLNALKLDLDVRTRATPDQGIERDINAIVDATRRTRP